MNNNFTNEQIRAYAQGLMPGDAIWSDGKWHEVEGEAEEMSAGPRNRYISLNQVRILDGLVKQIHILGYFENRSLLEEPTIDMYLRHDELPLAEGDGFYIYENGMWRKHADLITHWQPLPASPIIAEEVSIAK